MTPLADAMARVRGVVEASREAAALGVKLMCAPKTAAIQADALDTLLAALPTEEERAAISAGADYLYGDQRERLIDYLNRTRTGGATDGD